MKKLLFLLALFLPVSAMHKHKHEQLPKIIYTDASHIAPFRINAFVNNRLAGYINFGANEINANLGHIEYIHVYEPYRGLGIGYTLFKRAIFALKKKGFKVITWDTMSLDDIPTKQLEEIYLAYIMKLQEKLEFDFIMEKRLGILDSQITPMKIILKDTNGIYPEGI